MEGLVCGRYRIVEKLGEGGMAEIWTARHDMLEQLAAIKLLQPEMSAQQQIVQRFLKEARAASAINHPGIVQIFDVGHAEDGRAYIAMERLQGESLGDRLKRVQALPVVQTRILIRQLASVMDAAHAQNIYHRDLKPDNLFITPDPEVDGGERIKVLDFGLAKLNSEYAGSLITAQGSIFGTPAYMSPEQCLDSGAVDGRADLYSIGCILFRCLCGRPPFELSEPMALLQAQVRERPPRPRALRPDLPEALDALIMRLLEKQPENRLQTCADLLDALASEGAAEARVDHHAAEQAAAPVTSSHDAVTLVNLDESGAGRDVAGGMPATSADDVKTHVYMAPHRQAPTDRANMAPHRQAPTGRAIWLVPVALVIVGIAAAGLWMNLSAPDSRSAEDASTPVLPADGLSADGLSTDAALPVDVALDAGIAVRDATASAAADADRAIADATAVAQNGELTPVAAARPTLLAADVERLMDEGTKAFVGDDHAGALKACRRILASDRRHARANRLCALASCKLGNHKRAERYYKRVVAGQRASVRKVCLKAGIDPDPAGARP